MSESIQKLSPYLPEGTAPVIVDWIEKTNCQFRVSKSRSSKFGDYRSPWKDKGHRISVNGDLNPFAFLVTTVHEFAHLKTWNEYANRVKPHGIAWKQNFKQLMHPFLEGNVFPEDVRDAVRRYMKNPGASSCTDLTMFRTLKRYDLSRPESVTTVENLSDGACFVLPNGRAFQKIQKVRKRFRCVELSSQRVYLFSPIAEVRLKVDHEAKETEGHKI